MKKPASQGCKFADAGSKNCFRFLFYRVNFCGCGLCQRSDRRVHVRRSANVIKSMRAGSRRRDRSHLRPCALQTLGLPAGVASPASLGSPLSVPSACGRYEIYHLGSPRTPPGHRQASPSPASLRVSPCQYQRRVVGTMFTTTAAPWVQGHYSIARGACKLPAYPSGSSTSRTTSRSAKSRSVGPLLSNQLTVSIAAAAAGSPQAAR